MNTIAALALIFISFSSFAFTPDKEKDKKRKNKVEVIQSEDLTADNDLAGISGLEKQSVKVFDAKFNMVYSFTFTNQNEFENNPELKKLIGNSDLIMEDKNDKIYLLN